MNIKKVPGIVIYALRRRPDGQTEYYESVYDIAQIIRVAPVGTEFTVNSVQANTVAQVEEEDNDAQF